MSERRTTIGLIGRLRHSMVRRLKVLRWRLAVARDRVPLRLLVIITGQKCTLRCGDCGNFTPYLPQTFYEEEALRSDLEKLFAVASVMLLQVQGGEALVFPGLARLLAFLRGSRACSVEIATNGTRLLTAEQIPVVKALGAELRISAYEIVEARAQRLERQCRIEGIPYRVYRFANSTGSWTKMGGEETPRSSDHETRRRFERCPFNSCLTLEDGILARCSRATVAHKIQDFRPAPRDFVDVRRSDVESLRVALREYVHRPKPMEACSYCRIDSGEQVAPALQLGMSKADAAKVRSLPARTS